MTYEQHERDREEAAMGEAIARNFLAIMARHSFGDTMSSLQRAMYKDTDAGISISFQLHDGSFVYSGDARAREITDPQNWVRKIGASSIVEGSDREVELDWIDLADPKYLEEGGDELCADDFGTMCQEVNNAACAIWDEEHGDEDEDDETDE